MSSDDGFLIKQGTITNTQNNLGSITIQNTDSKINQTYAVIVGASPGSKYDKAKELNIPIWTEEEFLEKINS